jgi:hypothetical protein
MNARIPLVAALICLGACSDDTGILVEVHGEELQVPVVRLETMVIVDEGAGAPDSAAWGAAARVEATVADGLDLATDPYTVMIRPDGVGTDAAIWVAALAYGADNVLVGYGQLDAPVAFTSDVVKRFALHLHPATLNPEGCVVKDGVVVVRDTADCDGDQSPYTEDCDDLDPLIIEDLDGDPVVCFGDCEPGDPTIYPGATELCNGQDDDCDESTAPPPLLCVDVVREGKTILECGVGQQVCPDDVPGTDGYGPCFTAPVDVGTNAELCNRWADCVEAGGDLAACLVDTRYRCKLGVSDGGTACLPAVTALHNFTDALKCSWRLIGGTLQGGWDLGLRQAGTGNTLTSFVDVCDAELVVTAVPTERLPRVFLLETSDGITTEVISVLINPEPTGCDPQAASELECSEVSP